VIVSLTKLIYFYDVLMQEPNDCEFFKWVDEVDEVVEDEEFAIESKAKELPVEDTLPSLKMRNTLFKLEHDLMRLKMVITILVAIIAMLLYHIIMHM